MAERARVQFSLSSKPTLLVPRDRDRDEDKESDGVLVEYVTRVDAAAGKLAKFREDMANLPEEPSLDQYQGLPVEEFGEAVLRGMGWEEGKPIGRNCTTLVEPHEAVRRDNFRLGLGAAPTPPWWRRRQIPPFLN